jgi:hypothetical protein
MMPIFLRPDWMYECSKASSSRNLHRTPFFLLVFGVWIEREGGFVRCLTCLWKGFRDR